MKFFRLQSFAVVWCTSKIKFLLPASTKGNSKSRLSKIMHMKLRHESIMYELTDLLVFLLRWMPNVSFLSLSSFSSLFKLTITFILIVPNCDKKKEEDANCKQGGSLFQQVFNR